MIARQRGGAWNVRFSPEELARWKRFLKAFAPHVEMCERDWWQRAPNRKLWEVFVGEFLVRGGTRLVDRARENGKEWRQFLRRTSLRASLRASHAQLARTLRGRTRFHRVQAKAIKKCLCNPEVVHNNRFVLLDGLELLRSDEERREETCRRCPTLRLKGASNFLINVGAAKDLAAIDTRVVSCLERHFRFSHSASRVQSSKALYTALESALREVARRNGITLSQLDRAVFRAVGTAKLDFFMGGKPAYRGF
jgi:thermostable 8-oxoguanine DNA glycosylase